jgi:hypothetical protein
VSARRKTRRRVVFDRRDDPAAKILRVLRRVQWRYPVATQAAFSALVAEGRQAARTPEGKEMLARLSASPRVAKLRIIWEALSMNSFTEFEEEILPSFFLDELLRVAAASELEPLLSKLFELDG